MSATGFSGFDKPFFVLSCYLTFFQLLSDPQYYPMVTLIQLEYIVAVDTYRHFASAAESCHVTQPTLSMQIKKLEEQLGVTIFDRSRQPVIPTDVGAAIIAQARTILKENQKLDGIIMQYRQQVAGELKVGIIPTLAPYLLPRFVGNLVRTYPDIKLHVQEMLTEQILKALHKDLLDVGILVTPLHDASVIEKPLFYEEIKLYLNPRHPFVEEEKIELEDIARPDLWLLSKGHCFRSQVMNLCSSYQQQDPTLPIIYESGSLETLRKLVDVEGGFTLLPELAIQDLPDDRKWQIRSFSSNQPVREVSLVYTRNFAKAKLLKILGEHIKNSVPEEMAGAEKGNVVEWK